MLNVAKRWTIKNGTYPCIKINCQHQQTLYPVRAHTPRHQKLSSTTSSSSGSCRLRPHMTRRSRSWDVFVASSVLLAASYMASPFFSYSKVNSDTPKPFSTGIPGNPKVMLSPLEVTSALRQNEESYLIDRGKGIKRYDVAQLASNSPIEDDRSEKIFQVPVLAEDDKVHSSDWMFWGVYDGHGGWTTSAALRDSLITAVVKELDSVYTKSSSDSSPRLIPSPEAIDNAIERGFLTLDDQLVNKNIEKLLANPKKADASRIIAPALSGSCGLLAFYDTYSQNLRVAVAGDSRAVLGSKNSDGHWTATALSVDQTGSNIDEANRLRAEHPGEEKSVVRRGRVLGSLEPTRSFGDARYKWTSSFQAKIAREFFGRRIPDELKSPPYVTAKPVITTTKIHPENGDFLIMGSDGLFEMLTNEEVVSLVAQWIEKKNPQYLAGGSTDVGLWNKIFSGSSSSSSLLVQDISENKAGQKQPIRRRNGATSKFVLEDDNAATHLIRNALGGGDQDQVSMLVTIPAPISRNYRDDLTVTVVLFGKEAGGANDSGSITVNESATKNGKLVEKDEVKAKL